MTFSGCQKELGKALSMVLANLVTSETAPYLRHSLFVCLFVSCYLRNCSISKTLSVKVARYLGQFERCILLLGAGEASRADEAPRAGYTTPATLAY